MLDEILDWFRPAKVKIAHQERLNLKLEKKISDMEALKSAKAQTFKLESRMKELRNGKSTVSERQDPGSDTSGDRGEGPQETSVRPTTGARERTGALKRRRRQAGEGGTESKILRNTGSAKKAVREPKGEDRSRKEVGRTEQEEETPRSDTIDSQGTQERDRRNTQKKKEMQVKVAKDWPPQDL